VDRWKKLWATPLSLSDSETELEFSEFIEMLVPKHMHKQFQKLFGIPKAAFGNRFFRDDASFVNWETRFSIFVGEGEPVTATVIYGSRDSIEAHRLRGERRRSFRDVFIDDWFAACSIIRADDNLLAAFVEPKMRGCIVRSVRGSIVD
jgi:hypothetical protein